MHNLTTAMMSTMGDLVAAEARSALPDAPVHDTPVRAPRAARTRRATARVLHRAAHVVSPA